MNIGFKAKKCKVCKLSFIPSRSTQIVCGYSCALKHAKDKEEKKIRKENKKRKEALKTKSDYIKEAQKAFNEFIRYRDRGKPCISCGAAPESKRSDSNSLRGHLVDAGHYRSIGANCELRFEELNCHAQCVKCNRDLSGNIVEYRKELLLRIGQQKLDWLEGPHDMPKWSIEDIKQIKLKYKKKLKELKCSDK